MFGRIALTTAALLMSVATAAAQERVMRWSNWLPPTHPIVTGILQPWADELNTRTDGRIRVEFLPALGAPPAHFDLVRDGVADAAMSVHAYTADRFPSAYGMTFPGYADDATSASVAFWRVYDEHFRALDEFRGVQLLGLWTHGPGNIFTRNRELNSIDDARGLRLRATGGIVQDISESLGIVPQFASASEAYELLSRGVVDGVMFNSDSVYSFNMQDILTHGYRIPGGLYRDTHYVIMNPRFYDSLSEEDRAVIDELSGEYIARLAGHAWDTVENDAWERMEASDFGINVADEASLATIATAAEPLRAAWIERMAERGIDGEAVLDSFAAHIAEVSAE